MEVQLSQQASHKAEIHELYTEMLNTHEKSETQAAFSAKMRRPEQPILTVEAEPENMLNTVSPGRRSSWILASELMTPARPTTRGRSTCPIWSKSKKDVNYLEFPCSQEENNQEILSNKVYSRRARTSCRLRELLNLQTTKSHLMSIPFDALMAELFVRDNVIDEESPSTACNSSTVSTSTLGGVRLGAAEPPCFGQLPGLAQVPSIPLPPPPPRTSNTSSNAEVYPPQWTPLGAKSKTPPGGPPSGSNNQSTGSGGSDPNNPTGNAPSGSGGPGGNPGGVPPQQSGGAGQPGGHPGAPTGHQSLPQAQRPSDPWTPLDRSRKSLPQFKLLSNYKERSIL